MEENTQEEVKEDIAQEEAVEAQPVTNTSDEADAEKNKGMAILAYFIFFLPMLTDAKDSKFAMFHANQSLVLFLVAIVAQIAGMILAVITLDIGTILLPIVFIVIFVFWIMGIINASKGEMKELPLIGGIHILDKK